MMTQVSDKAKTCSNQKLAQVLRCSYPEDAVADVDGGKSTSARRSSAQGII